MDFDKNNEFGRMMHESRIRGRGASSRMMKDEEFDAVPQDNATPAAKSIEGWILFVAGLHDEATEEELNDIFCDFGAIKNIHLNLDRRTCYAKGYALIEYSDLISAENAIKSINGHELNGKILTVDWAFLKGPIAEGRQR